MADVTAQAREILAREWGSTIERLSAVDEPAWKRPTRCSGWDVRDLVRHTVWGVSMEADALRRRRLAEDGRADAAMPPDEAGTAELVDGLRHAVADLDAELGALLAVDGQRLVPLPYGDASLASALDIFVMEAGVHAADVAHALDDDRPLAPDVVAATVHVLRAFLPVLASAGRTSPPDGSTFALVGDTVRIEGSWSGGALTMDGAGQHPTLTVAGDDSSALLFALGRLAVGDPRLAVSGEDALARDFKIHVPGP